MNKKNFVIAVIIIVILSVINIGVFFYYKKYLEDKYYEAIKKELWLKPTDKNAFREVFYIPVSEDKKINGVPYDIFDRLIFSESSWNEKAVNINKYETSVGLAQINTKWLSYFSEKYGVTDPKNPYQAIDFASRYLYDLYKQTGNWYEAVLSYKCGYNNRYTASEQIKDISYWVAYGTKRKK